MKSKKKILFAANDIGWRIELYSKFIQKSYSKKMRASSFVNYFLPTSHYKTDYTYKENYLEKGSLQRWISSIYYFFKFVFSYDIFHFLSGETILTRKTRRLEFLIYKLFRKRIVMHFVGSDIRNVDILKWRDENQKDFINGKRSGIPPKKWQKLMIRDAIKYADSVLVSTPDLLSIIPGKAEFFPVVLDIEKFNGEIKKIKNVTKKRNEIVILHAPSNPKVKGTSHVLKALDEIKLTYGKRVRIISTAESSYSSGVYTASRYDVFQLMLEADIVIDQLLIGWYGLQAIEAIMTDNIVLSFIDDDLKKHLFPNTPIVNVNSQNIHQKISELIDSNTLKSYNFENAKDWVLQYHTIENNYHFLANAWGLNPDE